MTVSLASAGCRPTAPTAAPSGYPVDPLFRELVERLGGTSVLGPAISPLFTHENTHYQYVVAGLLVHEPGAPSRNRFRLAPLGLDMGIAEAGVPRPEDPAVRYVDGQVIAAPFAGKYDQLGGARFVGGPLTGLHYNPEKRRYEQYFSNLGFYYLKDDPEMNVYLLAYGAWKCGPACNTRAVASSNIVLLPQRSRGPLAAAAERLGTEFTGFALTHVYPANDGLYEQVFENLVLAYHPELPGRILARPIAPRLGILPDPLQPPAGAAGLEFYSIRDGMGYNVPDYFMRTIADHGGVAVSGPPINEPARLGDAHYRQCFTNLCLEVDLSVPAAPVVRPAALGYTYLSLNPVATPAVAASPLVSPLAAASPTPPQASFDETQSFRQVTIQVWEVYPILGRARRQEIGVSLFENNAPLALVSPRLIVALPGGLEWSYTMEPTGADGQTSLLLEAIDAPNGTLIPYQVCLVDRTNNETFCVKDSFLIWDSP